MTEQIKLADKELTVKHTEHGTDTLVVLVHGLTGNYLQMHHFQKALFRHYDTLSYDLAGRGDSQPQEDASSIDTHSRDLAELLDRYDYQSYILIGYSMGAYTTLKVASERNDIKRVVLLDGAGHADETTDELVLPSLARLSKTFDSFEEYQKLMQTSYGNMGVEWSGVMDLVLDHETYRQGGKYHHKSSQALTEQDFLSFYDYPHKKVYQKVDVPVLLVVCHGAIKEDKPLFNQWGYNEMLHTLPRITHVDSDTNHYELVFNVQKALNDEIITFLQGGEI